LTWAEVLTNLDLFDRNRVPKPPDYSDHDPRDLVRRYVRIGRLLQVEGLYQEHDQTRRFLARRITVLNDTEGVQFSERKHWWLTQIRELGDVWLEYLGMSEGRYDFSGYRTNIDLSGLPTGSGVQECATLSRLIYGLASAYMLTGSSRFLDAATAGVAYQRERFVSPTDDGRGILWAHGLENGHRVMTSRNADDRDTVALYEQIYALAGLTQYYRITLEPDVLYDIKRTIHAFNRFFHDCAAGQDDETRRGDGYFSHLDFADMSPHAERLGDNRSRKNWNSVGDHIPAYLINLILALDPLPSGLEDRETRKFLDVLKRMLDETAQLILTKLPEENDPTYFVRERFYRDWHPDFGWRWQQNRAIVGHNFKIAWNLTRVAAAFQNDGDIERADRYFAYSAKLCRRVAALGIDPIRGGVYDVIEREPPGQRDTAVPRLAWWPTKDFWQQEQAILASLVIYGYSKMLEQSEPTRWQSLEIGEPPEFFLQLARETMAFWNLYFLDRDDRGVYFRTTEDGLPYLEGMYRNRGGHSISGYHAFELNFLAHIYLSLFVRKPSDRLSLRFRPALGTQQRTINVLPDFVPRELLQIETVRVDGQLRSDNDFDSNKFNVKFTDDDLGREFVVQFGIKRQW
jgi:mannose/cellobiose epimerase-like protein (N-acyl-D-glucosamine 2-epimerase family)